MWSQVRPGLSAYAKDPQAAANSLVPLLNEAESVVPEEFSPKTPVKLGVSKLKHIVFNYFILISSSVLF